MRWFRREWGICEKGQPEPGWLSFDRADLAAKLRDGERLMSRWITGWKADNE